MFGMDPSAVPEPAEYSSPPSPRSNAGMDEDQVKEMVASIILFNVEKLCTI